MKPTSPALMTIDKSFSVLRDALWCGELGDREFIARCAQLGVNYDLVVHTMAELRAEDGITGAAA